MTREEQIRHEAGSLADFAIAHGAPWKEYHNGFIDGAKLADEHPVQPPLPSNLDEAAEKYESGLQNPDYQDSGYTDNDMIDAFKAGAEWMAGQGETHELTVESPVLGPPMICCPVHADNGDKVVVQIRKK